MMIISDRPTCPSLANKCEQNAILYILLVVCCAAIAWVPCSAESRIHTMRPQKAPSLEGGLEWLNSSGPIKLEQLRGKIVILDFWTYCCINCLQTLPDLKQLEKEFPNEIVVIGVHAPKFFGERDTENIREAIVRHDVEHPVVNDANVKIAKRYDVQGWPSLRFIDPQGNLFASHYGEATFEMLKSFINRSLPRFKRNGLLDTTPLHFDLERDRFPKEPTGLRFPGKVFSDGKSNRLFIADSGHHRIVIASLNGDLISTVGTGEPSLKDGAFHQASFSSPQGMALYNQKLFVADTENHAIRVIDLEKRTVSTVAGNGKQASPTFQPGQTRPAGGRLSSPWDVLLHQNELFVAMAGSHQIWKMSAQRRNMRPFAGNRLEDIVDGPLLPRRGSTESSSFAQPSGLATDGKWLFVADSEGSTIRAVPLSGKGFVTTLLGTAALPKKLRLFTYGDRDGPLKAALLQHPLGIVYWSGQLYVADTYNNKIKLIDLGSMRISTIANATGLNEPSGLSAANGKLYVADTNNHQIRVLDITNGGGLIELKIKGLKPPKKRAPPQLDFPGEKKSFGRVQINPSAMQLKLRIELKLPKDFVLNENAPMNVTTRVIQGDSILAKMANGKPNRVSAQQDLETHVQLAAQSGSARISVSLVYYYCENSATSLCKIGSVTWTGEVQLTESSDTKEIALNHQMVN